MEKNNNILEEGQMFTALSEEAKQIVLAYNDNVLNIIGTHPLPPRSKEYSSYRNDQLISVQKFIKTKQEPLILFGDLNVTPWSNYFKLLVKETDLLNRSFRDKPSEPYITP